MKDRGLGSRGAVLRMKMRMRMRMRMRVRIAESRCPGSTDGRMRARMIVCSPQVDERSYRPVVSEMNTLVDSCSAAIGVRVVRGVVSIARCDLRDYHPRSARMRRIGSFSFPPNNPISMYEVQYVSIHIALLITTLARRRR